MASLPPAISDTKTSCARTISRKFISRCRFTRTTSAAGCRKIPMHKLPNRAGSNWCQNTRRTLPFSSVPADGTRKFLPANRSTKHKISYAYYMGYRLAVITRRDADCFDVRPADGHGTEARGRTCFFPGRKIARQQPSQIRRQFSFCRRQRAGEPVRNSRFPLATAPGVVLLNPKP